MITEKERKIIEKRLSEEFAEYAENNLIDCWNMSPEEFEKEVQEFLKRRRLSH